MVEFLPRRLSELSGELTKRDAAQIAARNADKLKFKVGNMTHAALLIALKNLAAWIKAAKPLRTRSLFVLPLHRTEAEPNWVFFKVQ